MRESHEWENLIAGMIQTMPLENRLNNLGFYINVINKARDRDLENYKLALGIQKKEKRKKLV